MGDGKLAIWTCNSEHDAKIKFKVVQPGYKEELEEMSWQFVKTGRLR